MLRAVFRLFTWCNRTPNSRFYFCWIIIKCLRKLSWIWTYLLKNNCFQCEWCWGSLVKTFLNLYIIHIRRLVEILNMNVFTWNSVSFLTNGQPKSGNRCWISWSNLWLAFCLPLKWYELYHSSKNDCTIRLFFYKKKSLWPHNRVCNYSKVSLINISFFNVAV